MRLGTGTALTVDPRFSWWSAVPDSYAGTVLVLVHGSDRDPVGMRTAFLDWAQQTGTALLLPLFPAGVPVAGDPNAYKQLRSNGLHFDAVLWQIIEQFSADNALEIDHLELCGFSGGAQYAHRLALVHPRRFDSVALAAPGNVTLLSTDTPWWPGTSDFEAEFGTARDHAGLQQLPVHVIVGAEDSGSAVIHIDEDDPRWRPGANDSGTTRVDRARRLAENWASHGVPATLEVIPGVGHRLDQLAGAAQDFLSRARATTTTPPAAIQPPGVHT